MVGNINISVNILPFGQMKLKFTSSEGKLEVREYPAYIVPYSTSMEKVEILYGSLKEYKIPETTDGR